MNNINVEGQFDQIQRELEQLSQLTAEWARRRDETAKRVTRKEDMWGHLREQWDANRRRGSVPPLCESSPCSDLVGVDWWREQD